MVKYLSELKEHLIKLDKKSYNSLKEIQGTYEKENSLRLHIDYVQGDPFAAPSRIRIELPLDNTSLSEKMFLNSHRKIAFKHFFSKEFNSVQKNKKTNIAGTGKSGMIMIDAPGQEVIDRSSIKINTDYIEFRVSCGIPAKGRKIMGKAAAELLCNVLPAIAEECIASYDKKALEEALILSDDQHIIRDHLQKLNKTAFVANGSILPRRSGDSNRPLSSSSAVPFQTPGSFQHTIELTEGKRITGMLIDKGVTLIVGGGYHGKSTLLQALERGVYNHELNDGREYVITDPTAMKIRAEDRRGIWNVNISPFINELPMKKSTERFYSKDASGSTSQAANIMEAIETGSTTLLIDEDTSATNFMIRDGRMQHLVRKEKEPITPFVDRIRDLYDQMGVSTILVLGGSGDYFEAADSVIMMDEYMPLDKTAEAKKLTETHTSIREKEKGAPFPAFHERKFPYKEITEKLDRKEKIQSRGVDQISIGKNNLQLDAVEQLVSSSQTEAIAMMLKKIWKKNENKDIISLSEELYASIENDALDIISPYTGKHPGNIALPRKQELLAAINRIRS